MKKFKKIVSMTLISTVLVSSVNLGLADNDDRDNTEKVEQVNNKEAEKAKEKAEKEAEKAKEKEEKEKEKAEEEAEKAKEKAEKEAEKAKEKEEKEKEKAEEEAEKAKEKAEKEAEKAKEKEEKEKDDDKDDDEDDDDKDDDDDLNKEDKEISKKKDAIFKYKEEIKKTQEQINELKKELVELKKSIRGKYTQEEIDKVKQTTSQIKETYKNIKTLSVEDIIVKNKDIKFDTPPVIKENRTLVPVRAITEGFGAKVEWKQETKEVVITKDGNEIILKLDSKTALVNGKEVSLDVPSSAYSNRTYVPLRFIGENLGINVEWDKDLEIIKIHEDKDEVDNNTDNVSVE